MPPTAGARARATDPPTPKPPRSKARSSGTAPSNKRSRPSSSTASLPSLQAKPSKKSRPSASTSSLPSLSAGADGDDVRPRVAAPLTVDGGTYVVPVVRRVDPRRRVYAREIQALMHSFGEIRHASADAVEAVEDIVRSVILHLVCDMSRRKQLYGGAADVTATAMLYQNRPTDDNAVDISDVVRLLSRVDNNVGNKGLFARLEHSVKAICGPQHKDVNERLVKQAQLLFSIFHSPSVFIGNNCKNLDFYSSLAFLNLRAPVPRAPLQQQQRQRASMDQQNRLQSAWFKHLSGGDQNHVATWTAGSVFNHFMGKEVYAEFLKCKDVSLVSLSVPGSLKQFRDWLDAPHPLALSDDVLVLLAHVATEVVGLLTQHALLIKYAQNLAAGRYDPRSPNWSNYRHLMNALNHGLATAVLVPVTDHQLTKIMNEFTQLFAYNSKFINSAWTPHIHCTDPQLQPSHINEAYRQLVSDRHPLFDWDS